MGTSHVDYTAHPPALGAGSRHLPIKVSSRRGSLELASVAVPFMRHLTTIALLVIALTYPVAFIGAASETATPAADQSTVQQRQLAFLNRIRKSDPQHHTIERALFNNQNELGLILSRSVELDKIPALMRTMLAQMAREFPGQDLTVLAYTPSNPPRKIGTARLNARTRDMTYKPER
jgi:hypothetical protein